jgi:hypothetical protein
MTGIGNVRMTMTMMTFIERRKKVIRSMASIKGKRKKKCVDHKLGV